MTFPNSYVARVVDKTREAWGNTQQAIDAAAESLDLPAEDVARISAEEAYDAGLAEDAARDKAKKSPSNGKRNRQLVEA